MTSFRHPSETPIYYLTMLMLGGIVVVSALPTVCLMPLLVVGFIVLSYWMSKAHHNQLISHAYQVTPQSAPHLAALTQECIHRLQTVPVEFYVMPKQSLNAYTFGFSKPNVVVVYSPMLKVMDADELRFVIGHELGHVSLGHTWLNTLLGGMAGVPVSFGAAVVLTLAFRWWNRACEYSADRAGLLACGSLNKSISALAQLAVGDINTQDELSRAMQVIERQDSEAASSLSELLSTHPLILKRINELRAWAATPEYQRLSQKI